MRWIRRLNMSSIYEDKDKEILDRLRRIETKVSKVLEGSSEEPVFTLTDHHGYHLDITSGTMTVKRLEEVLCAGVVEHDDPVAVYDSGRYVFSIIYEG